MYTSVNWSPEMEQTYSFRNYQQDVLIWCLTTDLQPHQQCAAVIQRLGGTARDLARQMTPAELLNGGMVNGAQVDPVSLLLDGLQQRFGMLEGDQTCSIDRFHDLSQAPQ